MQSYPMHVTLLIAIHQRCCTRNTVSTLGYLWTWREAWGSSGRVEDDCAPQCTLGLQDDKQPCVFKCVLANRGALMGIQLWVAGNRNSIEHRHGFLPGSPARFPRLPAAREDSEKKNIPFQKPLWEHMTLGATHAAHARLISITHRKLCLPCSTSVPSALSSSSRSAPAPSSRPKVRDTSFLTVSFCRLGRPAPSTDRAPHPLTFPHLAAPSVLSQKTGWVGFLGGVRNCPAGVRSEPGYLLDCAALRSPLSPSLAPVLLPPIGSEACSGNLHAWENG